MRIINQDPGNGKRQTSDKKRKKKRIGGSILLLLLLLSLFFYRDTLWEIVDGIRRVTWKELGCSIFLAFLGYIFEGLTIFVMMGVFVSRTKARDGIFIAFVCEFYRLTTLGNGSGFAEIHYLHEKGVEPGSATVLTMIQYVMKRVAIMLFGLAGFAYLFIGETTRISGREYLAFVGTGCLVTILVITVFLGLVLYSRVADALVWVMDWLSAQIRSQETRFGKWKEQIRLLNRSGRSVLGHKKKMLCVVLLQIGKLTVFYMIPACLLHGNAGLTVRACVLIMAVAFMLAGVIPAPSGAGALEFVFLLFFTCFVDSGTAVSAVLIFRFATWICPAIVGGIVLFCHNSLWFGHFKK